MESRRLCFFFRGSLGERYNDEVEAGSQGAQGHRRPRLGIFTGISHRIHVDVSVNGGTPKSSILIGFSIINHPFWGTPIFGNPHVWYICLHLAASLNVGKYAASHGSSSVGSFSGDCLWILPW